jgi:glycine hydroxymethyltransferase
VRQRSWVPSDQETDVQSIANAAGSASAADVLTQIDALTEQNTVIYAEECVQLTPAANVMNPRAEAALAAGLGSRPSLGYPGDKYEMGLEAVEQIEVIAAQLACEVFSADFAEVRVGSGALGNLYAFMACCQPGDSIIVPPASIGGHVTHNDA